MTLQRVVTLPRLARFPEASWRTHMTPEEWIFCLDAWILLVEAHLSLTPSEFEGKSAKDESVTTFLITYMAEMAQSPSILSFGDLVRSKALRKACFFLSSRLLGITPASERLLAWDFLANFCKVYGGKYSTKLIAGIWAKNSNGLEQSFTAFKSSLVKQLEAGIDGDADAIELEKKLKQLNHLLHTSPETATFFMSGSDFLDALVFCYKLMNPPLCKVIICTTYLSLVGIINGSNPNVSLLTDQLYALNAEANAPKTISDTGDSLVKGLVSETPILGKILQHAKESGTGLGKVNSVIKILKSFPTTRKYRRNKQTKEIDKGKGICYENGSAFEYGNGNGTPRQIHAHQMSLISQIQDLFPELGSGFILKLLEAYNDDVEQVVSHLIEGSLLPHLEQIDRTETLDPTEEESTHKLSNIAPRQTPSMLPSRHNVFDGDEFDQLAVDVSRIYFGRRDPDSTADDILKDRSNAPNKAAILSALAAFDSDDDERDDTYDIGDVGGTVDLANPGNEPEEADADANEMIDEILFRAFKATPAVFDRDAATRRSKPRIALKEETGMTDEAIEGWALMLSRNPQRARLLETMFSGFSGVLASSTWRTNEGSGNDESDGIGKKEEVGHRGRAHSGRGGRGGGNTSVATDGKETKDARHRKAANKGSGANHDRRNQRAKKMGRNGLQG